MTDPRPQTTQNYPGVYSHSIHQQDLALTMMPNLADGTTHDALYYILGKNMADWVMRLINSSNDPSKRFASVAGRMIMDADNRYSQGGEGPLTFHSEDTWTQAAGYLKTAYLTYPILGDLLVDHGLDMFPSEPVIHHDVGKTAPEVYEMLIKYEGKPPDIYKYMHAILGFVIADLCAEPFSQTRGWPLHRRFARILNGSITSIHHLLLQGYLLKEWLPKPINYHSTEIDAIYDTFGDVTDQLPDALKLRFAVNYRDQIGENGARKNKHFSTLMKLQSAITIRRLFFKQGTPPSVLMGRIAAFFTAATCLVDSYSAQKDPHRVYRNGVISSHEALQNLFDSSQRLNLPTYLYYLLAQAVKPDLRASCAELRARELG